MLAIIVHSDYQGAVMSGLLTWDAVLERTDLIGGDIECQEDGRVYRGPLSAIHRQGDEIRFDSPWCAQLDMTTGLWQNWHIITSSVPDAVAPRDIGEGRVLFEIPYLGIGTLFPAAGSKLDPKKVEGLPKSYERFLRLFPDLPYDRDVVTQVCAERAFDWMVADLTALPDGSSLTDVCKVFRNDSSAEEFMWYYVETLTGEQGVRRKVY